MSSYADASFLGALYGNENNTTQALAYVSRSRNAIVVSSFAELELFNAVQLRVFRREFSSQEALKVLGNIAEDFQNGVFVTRLVPDSAFPRARQLSEKWTRQLGIRSGDVLHVAIALEYGTESFFSFDKRQLKLAEFEGLKTR